jgi:hypothetical protein
MSKGSISKKEIPTPAKVIRKEEKEEEELCKMMTVNWSHLHTGAGSRVRAEGNSF